jgi:hypothetical protein
MEKPRTISKDLNVKAVIRRIYGKEDTTKYIEKNIGSIFG